MKKLEIFDPALCCNTGVCGSEADEALITFSADLNWLKQQGIIIERYNLSQQPMVFAKNASVSSFLNRSGEEGLPLILLDGEFMLSGRYPERGELKRWYGFVDSPKSNVEKDGPQCCRQSTGCC